MHPPAFECPYPGCGRQFNVSSNMRRHYRNHSSPSAMQGAGMGMGPYGMGMGMHGMHGMGMGMGMPGMGMGMQGMGMGMGMGGGMGMHPHQQHHPMAMGMHPGNAPMMGGAVHPGMMGMYGAPPPPPSQQHQHPHHAPPPPPPQHPHHQQLPPPMSSLGLGQGQQGQQGQQQQPDPRYGAPAFERGYARGQPQSQQQTYPPAPGYGSAPSQQQQQQQPHLHGYGPTPHELVQREYDRRERDARRMEERAALYREDQRQHQRQDRDRQHQQHQGQQQAPPLQLHPSFPSHPASFSAHPLPYGHTFVHTVAPGSSSSAVDEDRKDGYSRPAVAEESRMRADWDREDEKERVLAMERDRERDRDAMSAASVRERGRAAYMHGVGAYTSSPAVSASTTYAYGVATASSSGHGHTGGEEESPSLSPALSSTSSLPGSGSAHSPHTRYAHSASTHSHSTQSHAHSASTHSHAPSTHSTRSARSAVGAWREREREHLRARREREREMEKERNREREAYGGYPHRRAVPHGYGHGHTQSAPGLTSFAPSSLPTSPPPSLRDRDIIVEPPSAEPVGVADRERERERDREKGTGHGRSHSYTTAAYAFHPSASLTSISNVRGHHHHPVHHRVRRDSTSARTGHEGEGMDTEGDVPDSASEPDVDDDRAQRFGAFGRPGPGAGAGRKRQMMEVEVEVDPDRMEGSDVEIDQLADDTDDVVMRLDRAGAPDMRMGMGRHGHGNGLRGREVWPEDEDDRLSVSSLSTQSHSQHSHSQHAHSYHGHTTQAAPPPPPPSFARSGSSGNSLSHARSSYTLSSNQRALDATAATARPRSRSLRGAQEPYAYPPHVASSYSGAPSSFGGPAVPGGEKGHRRTGSGSSSGHGHYSHPYARPAGRGGTGHSTLARERERERPLPPLPAQAVASPRMASNATSSGSATVVSAEGQSAATKAVKEEESAGNATTPTKAAFKFPMYTFPPPAPPHAADAPVGEAK